MQAVLNKTFVDVIIDSPVDQPETKRQSTAPMPLLGRLLSTTSEGERQKCANNRPMYSCIGSNWEKIVPPSSKIADANDISRKENACCNVADCNKGAVHAVENRTFVDIIDSPADRPETKRQSTEPMPSLGRLLSTTSEGERQECGNNRPMYSCIGSNWEKIVPPSSGIADESDPTWSVVPLSQSARVGPPAFNGASQDTEDGADSHDDSAPFSHKLNRQGLNAFSVPAQPFSVPAQPICTPGVYVGQVHLPTLMGSYLVPTMTTPETYSFESPKCSNFKSVAAPAHSEHCEEEQKDDSTTLMLRNLPNNYTRDFLICLLDTHGFARKFNFLYYPVDFQTRNGLGFAFVNLITHADACMVKAKLEGFKNWEIPSSKICTVGWSSNGQQGLKANIERYQNSSVMHKSVPDEHKPVLFRDGVRVKFPPPTKRLWPPCTNHGSRARKQ